jgi:hypothetical protein
MRVTAWLRRAASSLPSLRPYFSYG